MKLTFQKCIAMMTKKQRTQRYDQFQINFIARQAHAQFNSVKLKKIICGITSFFLYACDSDTYEYMEHTQRVRK